MQIGCFWSASCWSLKFCFSDSVRAASCRRSIAKHETLTVGYGGVIVIWSKQIKLLRPVYNKIRNLWLNKNLVVIQPYVEARLVSESLIVRKRILNIETSWYLDTNIRVGIFKHWSKLITNLTIPCPLSHQNFFACWHRYDFCTQLTPSSTRMEVPIQVVVHPSRA